MKTQDLNFDVNFCKTHATTFPVRPLYYYAVSLVSWFYYIPSKYDL